MLVEFTNRDKVQGPIYVESENVLTVDASVPGDASRGTEIRMPDNVRVYTQETPAEVAKKLNAAGQTVVAQREK